MKQAHAFVAGAGMINVDLIYGGLEHIPAEGEEVFSQHFQMRLGGGIPATLLNLRGLNVPVSIQTALGDDLFSHFAAEEIRRFGTAPLNLYHGSSIPLNISSVLLTQRDRTFVSYTGGAGQAGSYDDAIYRASTGAAYVQMGMGSPDVYRTLKAEGTKLLFDTGWDDGLSLERYRQQLELADFYTPNQKEALKITGARSPEKAAQILSRYFDQVIIKLDKDGCLIQTKGAQQIIPSIPCFHHRDSTGAGDAFTAGLLYGLYHGYSFAECVLFGNITGGKCVTGVGCLTERCTEPELLELFHRYRPSIA